MMKNLKIKNSCISVALADIQLKQPPLLRSIYSLICLKLNLIYSFNCALQPFFPWYTFSQIFKNIVGKV